MTSRIEKKLAFFRVPTALEEIEEHMFSSGVDIEVSCVHTNLDSSGGLQTVRYDSDIAAIARTHFTVGSQKLLFLTRTRWFGKRG